MERFVGRMLASLVMGAVTPAFWLLERLSAWSLTRD